MINGRLLALHTVVVCVATFSTRWTTCDTRSQALTTLELAVLSWLDGRDSALRWLRLTLVGRAIIDTVGIASSRGRFVFREGRMRVGVLVLCCILLGCAASPEKLVSVGKSEAERMAPPIKPFSNYGNYELKPMVLSAAVQSEPGKVRAAGELESTLRTKLQPLLAQWKTASSNRSGTLVIEPHLASLKIVSGGARFWAGGLAGDSSIDMDLVMTDQGTGQQIAKARVTRTADAMTGGWSIGKSDENLLDYIASIAYEYMKAYY